MEWISKIKAFYHRKLDGYSFEEYLIMFVTCSIFLPYFCSIAADPVYIADLSDRLHGSARPQSSAGHRMLSVRLCLLFCFPVVVSACVTTTGIGMVQSLGMLIIFRVLYVLPQHHQ